MIDEVLAAVFWAPSSYTAEDVVEISCHGGVYVTRKILESVIANGARLAQPGEFTKRAFLNGRIDLSQAEAVADLIKSQSELGRKSSLIQLQGSLSKKINDLMDKLIRICSLIELELDFVEENISLTNTANLREELISIRSEIESLVLSFTRGRLHRDGVKVVLVGRPNAGKSSLLNALLDQNRAIVTDVPGTTRDVIEECIVLDGMLFRLIDTAGLRPTEDIVEKEGVRRTRDQIKNADVCLYVVDISKEDNGDDVEFIKEVKNIKNGEPFSEIFIGNKIDLVNNSGHSTPRMGVLEEQFRMKGVAVSALKRIGIEDITKELVATSSQNALNLADSSVVVTNQRHRLALLDAIKSLNLALQSLERNMSGEVTAVDIRGAIDSLGLIVGKVTTDDILNNIFSKFCIGK